MMKIYGDTNSGNCLKVKWVCDHLALPYDWVGVDTLKGETRTTEFSSSTAPARCRRWIRQRPRAGAIQRDHPLSRPRQRSDPHGCVCGGQDGRMAVLGAVQPRALYRGVPFQMVYLGKPASDLDPDKIKRGYAALARMEHQLAATRFLAGDAVSLADVSLLAYTRLAHQGGFHLDGYAAMRRWIGEAERARLATGALRSFSRETSRPARLPFTSAVPAATTSASIVAMLGTTICLPAFACARGLRDNTRIASGGRDSAFRLTGDKLT